MKIRCIQPNNSFKAIYKVKVPKEIFSNSRNPLECKFEFDKFFSGSNGAFADSNGSYRSYIESAGYEHAIKQLYLGNYGSCSVDWLNRNSRSNIKLPEDNENHTFYVLTDKDAKKAQKKLDMSTLKHLMLFSKVLKREKQNLPTDDSGLNYLFVESRISEILDKKMDEIIQDGTVVTLLAEEV